MARTRPVRIGYSPQGLLGPLASLLLLLPAPPSPGTSDVSREPPASAGTPVLPDRNALSVAAAIVPGLLVHGSGHFAGGDRQTARRLLALEGVGLATAVAGVAGLAVTGASRRLVAPLIWTTVAGAGLLATSATADLYGVLARGGAGSPLPHTPWLQVRIGGRYVYNPTLPYRWLTGPGADLWIGAWRISPALWTTVDAGALRAEGYVAYRFLGARPHGAAPARTASTADVIAGLVHHHERGPGRRFSTTTGEIAFQGRLDGSQIAPSLAGSFFEGAVGLALGGTHYHGAGATEATDLLLARFGYGFFIGRGASPRAEVLLAYDHRHDDFAGGLKAPGLGSGAAGHFGVEATTFLHEHWGFSAEASAGSALVVGLSLVYRRGRVTP